jgi:hypothetical protein
MSLSSRRIACSTGIRVVRGLREGGIVIRTERRDVKRGCEARRCRELRTRHETPSPTQGNQLADLPTVPREDERLAMFDGVQDLLRPHPQVTLTDSGL